MADAPANPCSLHIPTRAWIGTGQTSAVGGEEVLSRTEVLISKAEGKVKTAAIFVFSLVNATWVFIAYLLHIAGFSARFIAIVVAIGVVLGNGAVYGGLKLTRKLLPKASSD